MLVSRNEAADALHAIAAAENRSSQAYRYEHAAPHLILWGILWAVGYGLTDLAPGSANLIWTAVVLTGFVVDVIVEMRVRTADATFGWRFAAIGAIAFVFFAATFAIMNPASGKQIGAFVPLVVATAYALVGIFAGLRFIIAGAIIAALTLIGFFVVPIH